MSVMDKLREPVAQKSDKKLGVRINWFNALLAVLLALAAAFAQHLRDWNPGTFTGTSFVGIVILALAAMIVGGLMALAFESHEKWPVVAAFLLGLCTGIGGVVFFYLTDVGAKELIAGLVTFIVIGGLTVAIAVTRWWRP